MPKVTGSRNTCQLQGLKTSTMYQITKTYEDPTLVVLVVTTPFFNSFFEGWKHNFDLEVVYTSQIRDIQLTRVSKKLEGFDFPQETLVLEIVDTSITPTIFNKVIIDIVDDLSNKIAESEPRNWYSLLYKDTKCRLSKRIEFLSDSDDSSHVYYNGLYLDINLHLEIVRDPSPIINPIIREQD